MSGRRELRLDSIFESELEEYEKSRKIEEGLDKGNIKAYLEAMKVGMMEELLKKLCKERYTGDLRTDIIMGAFYANILAHNGMYDFYIIKSSLLEYVFDNKIWGEKPYDSYGTSEDSNGNEVAYFDVPNCGQVSFHLVDTYYDETLIPEYELGWCRKPNNDFPTYSCIENLHNLLMALKCRQNNYLGDAVEALRPINFFLMNPKEIRECYFVDLDDFYYEQDEIYYYDKEIIPEKLIDFIILRRIVFSKEEGLISDKYINDKEEKIKILKQNAKYNGKIQDILVDLGFIEIDENSR